MNTQGLLLELLLAGFFGVACLRARGKENGLPAAWKDFVYLTGRLERLRLSRWQWCSMVFLVLLVRRQVGVPLVLELTLLLQWVVFMVLPVAAPAQEESALCK